MTPLSKQHKTKQKKASLSKSQKEVTDAQSKCFLVRAFTVAPGNPE